jgi:hypothetical protein
VITNVLSTVDPGVAFEFITKNSEIITNLF